MAAPSRMAQYEVRNDGTGPYASYRCEKCGREFHSRPATPASTPQDLGAQVVGNLLSRVTGGTVAAQARGLDQPQINLAWSQVVANFRECPACHRVVCAADFDEASGFCLDHRPVPAKSAAAGGARCVKCGADVTGVKFCTNCGTKVEAAPVPPKSKASTKAAKPATTAKPASAAKPAAAAAPTAKQATPTAAAKPPAGAAKRSKKGPDLLEAVAKEGVMGAVGGAMRNAVNEAVSEAVTGAVSQAAEAAGVSPDMIKTVTQAPKEARRTIAHAKALPGQLAETVAAAPGQMLQNAAESVAQQIRLRTINLNASTGQIEVFFTTPAVHAKTGGLDERLAATLDQTKQTVDIAAFDFDLMPVAEAIVRAVRRGVRVRLVTDSDNLEHEAVALVKQAGVKVVDDRREAFMHNKFVVLDNQEVWTGSWNLTFSCTYRNNNNLIILHSPEVAANYTADFVKMFEKQQFGGGPATTHTHLRVGEVQIENYFAPEDDVFSHLLPVVQGARRSIRFLAFSLTEDALAKLLVAKRQAGLTVQGVMDARNATGTGAEWEPLRRQGLEVRMDGNPYAMHDKVIIVDESIVVTGSFNFTQSADRSNDENVVILYSTDIARRYGEEFQRIYQLGADH